MSLPMTDRGQKQEYRKCRVKHGTKREQTIGKTDTTSGRKTLKLPKTSRGFCREWWHIERGNPCHHSLDLIRCASLSSLAAVRAFPQCPRHNSVILMGKLRLRRIRQTAELSVKDFEGFHEMLHSNVQAFQT